MKIPQYAQAKRHPGFMPGSAVPDAPHLDAPTTSLAEMRTPAQGRGDGEGYASAETSSSARALTRARDGLGVPFRLHGRDLRGMDCVGLIAWAWDVPAPTGYALRASPVARIERELAALGFVVGMAPGAIVLAAPGAGQLHLGISTGSGIIHADAVARRVVERAAPLPWPILAGWIREA